MTRRPMSTEALIGVRSVNLRKDPRSVWPWWSRAGAILLSRRVWGEVIWLGALVHLLPGLRGSP